MRWLPALAVCLLATCTRSPSNGGDLVPVPGSGDLPYVTGRFVAVERPFTFSDVLVRNVGESPLVLDSVELVEPTDAIKIVGALVGYPTGPVRTGTAIFPPDTPKQLTPLEGFEVPPNSGPLQVFVGLSAEDGNSGTFRGVAINYHAGSESFVLVAPIALQACAPPSAFRGPDALRCDSPPSVLPASADRRT